MPAGRVGNRAVSIPKPGITLRSPTGPAPTDHMLPGCRLLAPLPLPDRVLSRRPPAIRAFVDEEPNIRCGAKAEPLWLAARSPTTMPYSTPLHSQG